MHTDPAAADDEFRHPFDPSVWASPYPSYRWLAEHDALHRDRFSGMVFLSRYADCDTLLRDRSASAEQAQQQRRRGEPLPNTMLNSDPPEHERLRAPAMRLLGPAVIDSLADALRQRVDGVLDRLTGEQVVDAVADVGRPFATAVLAELLDLPDEDASTFTALARGASVHLDPLAGPDQIAKGAQASALLAELLRNCAQRSPDGRPLARFWREAELAEPERDATLMLVVVGGFEPLVNVAATGLHLLAGHRDLVPDVAGGKAEAFLDEVLRVESPIPFVAREFSRDCVLPSGSVEQGARALALLAAGNRDPQVFEEPDELRLDRGTNPHLAFGAGVHFCPAAPLVRLAGAHLFTELARRFPNLGPDDPSARPRWRRSIVPRGLAGSAIRLAP